MAEGRVLGLGGLFFRANDPAALRAWYKTHLDLDLGQPWSMEAGIAVVQAFDHDTDYWPEAKQAMFNLRVQGLDALLARLALAGIPAERRPEEWDHPEIGRFARIEDPEGNAIELWEPAS